MEFRILGPLEVEEDGRQVALGGEKQRALLALLLLSRGRPVSTDRLIEEVWSGRPPATAVKSVQVYVTRLRRALGEGRIITRSRGYELAVAPGELDVDCFDALVRAASGAPAKEAAERLREALALFRGRPLSDLSLEPWAQVEIAGLEERQLAALEARIDADLELGRHRELIAELEAVLTEHPFREHLLEQLVLALYRSGRQADALDAYRRGAGRLRSELGLEPGRSLQELEARILRQDAALDPPRVGVRRDAHVRSWRLVVVGAIVIVAAAVAALGVAFTRGSDTSLASVAAGVAIVDASSGRLVAHIGASQIKVPAEVITGDGSFWVWNLRPYETVQIDPDNGHVVRRIGSPLGDTGGSGIVDGRSLWLGGPRLVRMDIPQGREVDRFRLSRNPQEDGLAGLALGDGSFWVTRPVAGELLRIDRATGAVQHRFAGLPDATGVVFGDGAVWVQSGHGVDRIDPNTNTITATAPVPKPELVNLAVGGGYLWASDETKGTVYKVDDHSGRIVDTYETGDGARQESYADGTLWVANQDVGTVTGIDAATGESRVLRFGHPLQSVAALHGKLLVEMNPGRTYEDRIDALGGNVARLIVPIYQLANDNHPDPAVAPSNPFIFQAERATCAPLLGYADAPPPRGQQLVPEAAAAMPVVSSDRRTYTFVLRKTFRFAPPSNAPLDAETFRYSIERALSPKLGSDTPGIRILGDLVGAQAFHVGRKAHVSGVRVRGDRISFTLIRPSPDFLERLALPYFCPVPRDTPILPGGVEFFPPPGGGPYAFRGFIFNGEYAILTRNPNYGGSRPQRLDAIGLREGIDTAKAVAHVQRGSWDAVEDFDPALAPGGIVARRFGGGGGQRLSYRSFPRPLTFYLAFDASRPPFSDRRLREAVTLALDRQALSAFWNQAPTGVATAGPAALRSAPTDMEPTARIIPPGVRGGGAAGFQPTDLERAVALTHRRRVRARMAVQAGEHRSRAFAGLVRSALAPLGIEVRPVAVADVSASLRDPAANIQLAALGTQLDYPDPASFLTQMLGHDVPATWLPRFVHAHVLRLSRLSGFARDRAAIRLASRLGMREVPVVAYGTPTLGAVLGDGLGCRVWNGVDAGLDLAALCVRR
jgi:DNA-binding SARP family transcriptional activator/ABC-type oligopeptide transport system substrate-binding subunit/outer membrane protein assembly factor BamB